MPQPGQADPTEGRIAGEIAVNFAALIAAILPAVLSFFAAQSGQRSGFMRAEAPVAAKRR
jgi:hypothetical protein